VFGDDEVEEDRKRCSPKSQRYHCDHNDSQSNIVPRETMNAKPRNAMGPTRAQILGLLKIKLNGI
jgi:hypothetical protein